MHNQELSDPATLSLYRNALRLSGVGAWEVDYVTNTTRWSDELRTILELPPDFVPDPDAFPGFAREGEHRDRLRQAVAEARETGGRWDLELLFLTAEGREKWVRSIGQAECRDGTCQTLYGTLEDIDARKKAEASLQSSVKLFEDYMFALDESSIIALTDAGGVITSVNDNFCRISRYSREELIGRTHRVINSGFHPPEFFRDLWRTISSGNTWRGEIKNKTKGGKYYWVYTTITPFLDHRGRPYQYLSIRFDITEKKLAEEALVNSLRENSSILESIGDGFFATDKNLVVTYWNKEAEKILQTPRDTIIGLSLRDIFPQEDNQAAFDTYLRAITRNETAHFENYSGLRDKWFEISAYPTGEGLSVYFKDVSERKASEARLNQLNENLLRQARALAASNADLEQFAYVASHDLQEPLRMVTGFLTQLEKRYKDTIDERGKRYIDFAVDGAKRMRQTILDLLEYSRVGRKEKGTELVDPNELIAEIRILFQKKIEARQATIHTGKLPVLKGDKAPLRQVFQNLISNALKYADANRPARIDVEAVETGTHWEFCIRDNGIGIPEEYFEKIFVIFQRLHNRDAYEGNGMGLTIAKRIVENYGGRIRVSSVEGKGSTFCFTIEKPQQ